MAKCILRMVVMFVFVDITFYSFALEFRCCRMIPLANHKLTFDERIGCVTRHDDLCREVIGQFHYKLLLYSKLAKAQ